MDLAYLHAPKSRAFFAGESRDDVPPDHTLLHLDVAVSFLRAGHLLGPGRYKLTLEVAAANVAPRVFEVEITHSGDWYPIEDVMRTRGVTIGPVTQR